LRANNAAPKLKMMIIEISRKGMFPPMRSNAVKVPEARIVGIDINIEMRAASFRVNPAQRAPVIVMPEREVPGIKAMACQSPNINASRHVRVSILRWFRAL